MSVELMPSLPDLVLALVSLGSAGIAVRVELTARRRDREWRKQIRSMEREWQLRFAQESQRIEEVSRDLEDRSRGRAGVSRINREKRSEALFMIRRGDSAETVATILAVPQNEIDLLVKVQRLGSKASTGTLPER